jgi:amidophosphoribosyltransferase
MGHDGDLISATLSVEEIRQHISADSLAFLSLDGMMRAIAMRRQSGRLTATPASPEYPLAVSDAQAKLSFEGVLA